MEIFNNTTTGRRTSRENQKVMLVNKHGLVEVDITLEDGKRGNYYIASVTPTAEFPLDIPKGNNPRDTDFKKVEKLAEAYTSANCFSAENGGIYAIVQNGSVFYDKNNNILEFVCDTSQGHGHNDGGHTLAAIQKSCKENGYNGKPVTLFLAEENIFPSLDARRSAAEAWNSRTPQKKQSEINVKGGFDLFKGHLSQKYLQNIEWKQNQLDPNGKTIPKECSAAEFFTLLSVVIPETYSDKYDVPWLMGLHHAGPSNMLKYIDNSNQAPATYLSQAANHSNTILELACHIQHSTAAGKAYFINRKRGPRDLKKSVTDRATFNIRAFDGTTAKGGLPKEFVLLCMRGLLHNKVTYDEDTNEFSFVPNVQLDDLKELWDSKKDKVLKLISKFAEDNLATEYKNRPQSMIKSNTLLRKVCNILA